MIESSHNYEAPRLTDEEAVDALRTMGADPAARAAFEQWLDGLQSELDAVYEAHGSRQFARASIEYGIRRADVYHKAGKTSEATADLSDTLDAAECVLFEGTDLAEKTLEALRKMRV